MTTRTALAALVLLSSVPTRSPAATKIEGEYQLMMELRKNFRAFPWDFDSNDGSIGTPAQVRLFSQPRPGVEAFLKFEADWRRGDNAADRPDFQYREGHLRFRREFGTRGLDAHLFSRQDRFWVDTYLIPFVQGRGDAQGIRLDAWGFLGANATLVLADQSAQLDPLNQFFQYRQRYGLPSNYPIDLAPMDSLAAQGRLRTDDAYVLRLRRSFFKEGRLRMGFTANRSETWTGRDSLSGPGVWRTVMGVDARYRLGKTDISFEYGESRPDTGRGQHPPFTLFKRETPVRLPDRAVAQFEIRSIQIGTQRLGYVGVTPGWWSRGPLYSNSLGGPGNDETGFNVQTYYLLPQRAVTLSNRVLRYGTKVSPSRTSTSEVYNEMYVEFVNGFTGKTAYRRRDNYRLQGRRLVRDTQLTWFNEMQVESRLAWLRVQSKLLDIGKPSKKQLFVVENRINLTDKTKVYNRFSLGNDPSILRKGIFTQLQYRPTGNMELFLQYGPDDIGGGSTPVDDGNLAGSGDQSDVIKFILKGNF